MLNKLKKAQGCIFGQYCGDAFGAPYEFKKENLFTVDENMQPSTFHKMPAGSITDDSAMAKCLSYSLIENGKYNPEKVMLKYVDWYRCNPSDMGKNTRKVLKAASDHAFVHNNIQQFEYFYVQDNVFMFAKANCYNNCQANGALMRVSPIGIFTHKVPLNRAIDMAIQDCLLTHNNEICKQANIVYMVALHAAMNIDDPEIVFNSVMDYVFNHHIEEFSPEIKDIIVNIYKNQNNSINQSNLIDDYYTNMGWVLIALYNALFCLKHFSSTKDAIMYTVNRGGDTDTNAAIVGALFGALYGIDSIPSNWMEVLLKSTPEKERNITTDIKNVFHSRDGFEIAEKLLG